MSRTDQDRLEEILLAIETIDRHLQRGPLEDLLVFDAICMRISQIGEAVRTLGPETKSRAPEIPWQDVAGMRNHLAHRYSKRAARSSPKPLSSICRDLGSPFALYWMVRVRQTHREDTPFLRVAQYLERHFTLGIEAVTPLRGQLRHSPVKGVVGDVGSLERKRQRAFAYGRVIVIRGNVGPTGQQPDCFDNLARNARLDVTVTLLKVCRN